ncbi:MAG: ATP-binding protein, partial [Flavobacteriales bacterium]|nr:ATP-binding protein [Flavobacteriales bacterium]
NNERSVRISFVHTNTGKAIILADREQMLRALNNLIRNAIQAIPEGRQGVIEVQLSKEGGFYFVRITDNGSGIAEELRDKIFIPNFTTKGSGMGLGLAMTHTIIENIDGEISYETQSNIGSTFIIKIPVIRY